MKLVLFNVMVSQLQVLLYGIDVWGGTIPIHVEWDWEDSNYVFKEKIGGYIHHLPLGYVVGNTCI